MMLIPIDELCFNNLKSFWSTLAGSDPANVVETSNSLRVNTGIEDPLYNPLFLKKDAKELPAAIPSSYSFWYDSKRNQAISAASLQKLQPIMQAVPMMSIDLNKEFNKQLSGDFQISIVTNNKDLSEWMAPIKIAFEMSEVIAARYQRGLESAPELFVHFTVKKNGLPIAAASLFLHDEIAGLYNLAVLPEFRKHNVAHAVQEITASAPAA